MEAISYQGLFHLSAGALAFVTMIAGLREWGLRRSLAAGISEDRSNLEWHGVDSLTVVDIIEETHDIKTFRLIRSEGRSFPTFQEGQFLTFQIPHGEGAVQRSYSISSSSLNNKVLSVSIKKISEGIGSSWFHGLSIGDTVKAYNPNGLFILGEEKYNSKTPQVLVAGGIGITPFISMIQGVLDIGSTTPLYLFYGCRTEDDMAFDLELKSLAKRYKNFHYTPVLSDAQGAWTGEKGFIGIHLIEKQIGDLNSAKYYFCGPPVMTDSLTEALLDKGVGSEQIHSEKFASPVSLDESTIESVQATVEVDGNVYSYNGKETLLEFFETQGLSINYACRVGVCGACKCKVESGEVDAFSDAGLTADEKKNHYVLTCVSRPKGPLKIKLNN